MKKFIFLPFIALIILTGCKSNSFTTQRYTKFGHKSHKTSSNEVVVRKETKATPAVEIVETETVKSSSIPVQLIASGFASLKENILKPERKAYNLNSNASDVKGSQASYSKEETVNSDNSMPVIKAQKTVKEKSHTRGLIGSAFETALWIVLVVIFVILIIFLLSVIF